MLIYQRDPEGNIWITRFKVRVWVKPWMCRSQEMLPEYTKIISCDMMWYGKFSCSFPSHCPDNHHDLSQSWLILILSQVLQYLLDSKHKLKLQNIKLRFQMLTAVFPDHFKSWRNWRCCPDRLGGWEIPCHEQQKVLFVHVKCKRNDYNYSIQRSEQDWSGRHICCSDSNVSHTFIMF